MRQEDDVQSLRWGIEVLRLINESQSISCAEFVAASGLSRTAAHRVLTTLQSMGFISRFGLPRRGRYRLAVGARALSDGFGTDQLLLEVAQPLLLGFTKAHGWPLALGVPAAGGTCFVCYTTDHATSRLLSRKRAGQVEHPDSSALARICLDATNPTDCSRRYAVDDVPASRELSLAVPLRFRGRLVGAMSLRYMRVGANGASGHELRLHGLEDLASRIEHALVDRAL